MLVFVVSIVVIIGGYEVFLRVSNAYNFDSTTAVGLNIYEDSPEISWEHKPGAVVGDYNGEDLVINKRGHRDSRISPFDSPEQVLVLGDSFTFGINVAQSKIFPSLMDNDEVDFMNAGAIGYSTDMHAAYLNKYLLNGGFKSDLVVLNFFVGNDVTELRRHEVLLEENQIPSIVDDVEVFVGEENTLESLKTPEPKSYAIYDLKNKFDALSRKFGAEVSSEPTLTWPVFLDPNHPGQDPSLDIYWNQTEEYLKGIKTALEVRDINFVVVIIPMDVQVSTSYWSKYPGMPFDEGAFKARRPQVRLTQFFEEEGIDYLDLLPVFTEDERKDEIYFAKDDSHFTNYGHEVVAGAILEKVEPILNY